MVGAAAKLPVVELLASFSLATDLGVGRPLGHGLSTCRVAVDLATAMGLTEDQLRHTQQLTLIRFLGCTTDAHETALMAGGDEIGFMSGFAPSHFGGTTEMAVALARNVGKGQSLGRRLR